LTSASNRRPLVVMFLTERPFGHDWARAARRVADVVTVAVVKDPVAARRRWETVHGPAAVDHWVPVFKVRPGGIFSRVNQRITAGRVEARLRRIESERGSISLLHGHFYARSSFLPHVRRSFGIPFVVTEHSTRLTRESAAHKPLSRTGLRIAADVFGTAGRVVAVSEYLRSCIAALGLPGDVEVIGNPIDTAVFRPPEQRPEEDLVVSIGRLESDKDPDLVVDAFALARAQIPSLRLEMIGDGPERRRIADRIDRQGLSGFVSISPYLPREAVAERLRSARVFALGSRVETFCVAAAEAISCGVPVVMPRIGPMPELVDESNGILLGDRDPAVMAESLLRAARGVFDANAMAAGIATRFGDEHVAAELARLYSAVGR